MYSPEHLRNLIDDELELYFKRTPKSLEAVKRAVNSMPLGVPTNVCSLDPYPIVIDHGDGARLTDIDGNEFIDFHAGFGTNVGGHLNPFIVAALDAQVKRGNHFGAVTPQVLPWAEHICGRFGLDWVRFSNSGTEATMDAVRLARAKTGRVKMIKIEGGYHGSHEAALVSGNQPLDESAGPDDRPNARPLSEGISPRVLEEVVVLPFNDLEQARRALEEEDIACVLIEPIMFNVGAIFPEDGYLQGLRDLCDDNGSLLIFDETKTCITVAYGGAEELFGVKPHIKTLGKGIGGGLPVGALGDTDGSCFGLIEQYKVAHLGTFAGNPLTASAGDAMLSQVLTHEAYEKFESNHQRMKTQLTAIIEELKLDAYVVGAASKGCIVWAPLPEIKDFRDYQRRFDFGVVTACWLFMINRGIFLSPGGDEQWTTSVFHGDAEIDRFCNVFREFAETLVSA